MLREKMDAARPALALAGTLIGGLGLGGTVLGWVNLVRLRRAAPPRRGLVLASVTALLAPFVLLWLVIAVNVRDEPVAWLDGITLTALLLLWFVCLMNPWPRPWSVMALGALTLAVLPVLFLAHAWRGHADAVDTRWAQELNDLQFQIYEAQSRLTAGIANESAVAGLQRELLNVQRQGGPVGRVPFSSGQRLCFALAACGAIGGTLLGWKARAQLRSEQPPVHRGRPMAECAAWFWPLVAGPVLLLFLA
jgi:hypothetical protein